MILTGHTTDDACLDVLKALLFTIRPPLIVEAGTYKGAFVVAATDSCPYAEVYTADTQKFWTDLPVSIKYHQLDFGDMLANLPAPQFAYIDSGPVDNEVTPMLRFNHYQLAKAAVSPGGYVVTHDTNERDWLGRDEIVTDAQLVLTCGAGLAIWRKS